MIKLGYKSGGLLKILSSEKRTVRNLCENSNPNVTKRQYILTSMVVPQEVKAGAVSRANYGGKTTP